VQPTAPGSRRPNDEEGWQQFGVERERPDKGLIARIATDRFASDTGRNRTARDVDCSAEFAHSVSLDQLQ
jgi:hypothetical protein